jgi:hypothetical protein
VAGTLLALAVVAAGAVILTDEKPALDKPAAPTQPAPPASSGGSQRPRPVKLTAADRQAIDAVLARFVPWAIGRERPAAAAALVTPALRAGATPAEWRRGVMPVTPYPADPRRSRGWTLNYSFRHRVSLDLLLLPRRGVKRGPLAMNVELVERRGRWLVDAAVPVAVFAAPGEAPRIVAQPDLGPLMPDAPRGPLSAAWLLLVPATLLVIPLLAVAGRLLRRRPKRR